MTIYDIVRKMQMLINSPTMSTVDRANLTSKLIKDFEDNFKIVPKEQWCVTITSSESIHSTQTIGPFEDEKIASLFASIWNRKREEFIDKTIEENPDGDYEFPYLLAKPNKIDWTDKCKEIQEEIFETLSTVGVKC